MKNTFKILLLFIFTVVLLFISYDCSFAKVTPLIKEHKTVNKNEKIKIEPKNQKPIVYQTVLPLDIVNKPGFYLNKNIKFIAKFDKFSALGLDYKPAMRNSKDYIAFLIRKPNLEGDYVIPLSEMKLIIKRSIAEKLTDLESGDEVEICGKVFSKALNDPWIDVSRLTILNSTKKKPKIKK